jgi:hypothetical protein
VTGDGEGEQDAGGGGDWGGGGAGTAAAAAEEGPADKVTSALTDALVKAIAYLATGAGFLTFVGVTGAAVTWMRLNAAELPATQALQLVGPRHLVADGAVALIAFAVLGLIAVTFIYVVDIPSRDTDEMRHGLTLLAVSESFIAIWLADRDLDLPHETAAFLGVAALGLVTIVIALLPERIKQPPQGSPLRRWLRQNMGKNIARFDPSPPTDQQLRAEIERRRLRARLGLELEPLPDKWKKRVRLGPMLVLALAAFAVGYVYVKHYHDWVGWSIWLAWGLGGLCFGVARTTERFWPYGLAVFFSVAVFGAWLNVVRLTDSPQLSPAALLRTGNDATAGVVGLYIARTDERYWLGAVTMSCKTVGGKLVPDHVEPDSGRIFSIPRSQVVDDTIGARTDIAKAGDEALAILAELVQRQPPGGAPPPDERAPPSTTATKPAAPTRGRQARSAAVPRTLAVGGRCMHRPRR